MERDGERDGEPGVERAAAEGGTSSALFSCRVERGVHVIRFSRPDVVDPTYLGRVGDDLYRHLKSASAPRVVIDLANVRHLSSSALGTFTALKTVIERAGGALAIAGADDQILRVFKLTGLNKLIDLDDDADRAVARLAKTAAG